jgi:hypothetical protein
MKIFLTAYATNSGSGNVHGSRPGGDVLGCALAEDGHVLAEHLSSSVGFAKHDMGLTSDWKHDRYREHAPDGYELEWVDDRKTHAGWQAALALNKLFADPENDPAVGQASGNPICPRAPRAFRRRSFCVGKLAPMTELPRYHWNEPEPFFGHPYMTQEPDGEWVKWADVSSRLQQLDTRWSSLRAELQDWATKIATQPEMMVKTPFEAIRCVLLEMQRVEHESRSTDGDVLVSVDTTGLLPGHATTRQRRAGEASTGENLTVETSGTLRSEACFNDGAASTAEGSKQAGSEPADSHQLSARVQQLEQEKATLQSLLELKKGSVAKLLEVQQRIAIVIGDTPPAEHVDYTLPSLVAFVVQEHDEAVAALAETREALQKALRFHQTTHIHAILREALARVDTTGLSDAVVPQPPSEPSSTPSPVKEQEP